APGATLELDLERAAPEDAAAFIALVERMEGAGRRARLVGAGPELYARLRALATLVIEVRRADDPAGPATERDEWGRFQVERVLVSRRGRIAFARDPRGARRVVLKVPAGEPAAFARVARAWAEKGLHPNLVGVLEVDPDRGLAVLEP